FVGAMITPPLAGVLPESIGHAGGEGQHRLEIISVTIALTGLILAVLLYAGERTLVSRIARSAPGQALGAWWYAAWGFDWLYDRLVVRPYLALATLLRRDPLDQGLGVIPRGAREGHVLLGRLQ